MMEDYTDSDSNFRSHPVHHAVNKIEYARRRLALVQNLRSKLYAVLSDPDIFSDYIGFEVQTRINDLNKEEAILNSVLEGVEV